MPVTAERPAHFKKQLSSPVGRKILSGATGLLLLVYLAQHLFANLQIFSDDPQAVSRYALFLADFGPLLIAAEIALGVLFLAHIVIGAIIWNRKRTARGTAYTLYKSKGSPSRQTLASRTMIVSGIVLLLFLILHVAYFRFGPGIAEGYVTFVDGEPMRHFERLVLERFQHVGYVAFYTLVMVLVGVHLSHGFWSAFQSLGLVNDRNRQQMYWGGIVLSVFIAGGFISIPLWIYFGMA